MNTESQLQRAFNVSLWALALMATLPAAAQYKVVQPDGRVVYTDRPPADSTSRVTAVGPAKPAAGAGSTSATASASALAAGLPTELRTAAQRYPVTLYATPDCPPCDNGRRLLQQRGIPYVEKQVTSDEDAQALERLLGARTLPSLAIGSQPLRGFAAADWQNFLDAAGYPRESRLPKTWKIAAAKPLTDRVVAPTASSALSAPPSAAPAPRLPLPDPVAPPPGTLRF